MVSGLYQASSFTGALSCGGLGALFVSLRRLGGGLSSEYDDSMKVLRQVLRSTGYLLILSLVLAVGPLVAQVGQRHSTYEAYVRKHYAEAIRQMNRHSVPASITMAQGLVETGAGKSSLAMQYNNHFGIKCHASWTGKRTYKDDDRANECFRHYDSWEESYEDHSLFLKRDRYTRLFALRHDDYRGWAKGLQNAGYATNKGYANKLISIIETYELYTLDNGKLPSWLADEEGVVHPPKRRTVRDSKTARQAESRKSAHHKKGEAHPARPIYTSYGLLYVLADPDDSLERIADEVGISARKLARYNDAPIDLRLQEGDVVYLEKKHHEADAQYKSHTVVVGDSMHSISQRYGLRLEDLYKMNDKDGEYIPMEGDVLRLR